MNGPEHYAEAEQLLAFADSPAAVVMGLARVIAAAQVHATLALAAATAEAASDSAVSGPLVVAPGSWAGGFENREGTPWGIALYGEPASKETRQ